MGNVLRK